MRNISILQIIILIILSVLVFSDFSRLKKKTLDILKKIVVKNKKKGS